MNGTGFKLRVYLLHFVGFVLLVKLVPYFERVLLNIDFVARIASPNSLVLEVLALGVAYAIFQTVLPRVVLGIVELGLK